MPDRLVDSIPCLRTNAQVLRREPAADALVLLEHARVREVSVIGRPDPEWGEVVVAYVVGEAERSELDALCLNGIARFKRPKEYVFVDTLPKNNYGKILKTELRERDLRQRKD
jgi:long-chain acyl-CoA synthetase